MVIPDKLRRFRIFSGLNINFCSRHGQNYIHIIILIILIIKVIIVIILMICNYDNLVWYLYSVIPDEEINPSGEIFALNGRLWESMEIYGSLRISMGIDGCLWESMGVYRNL